VRVRFFAGAADAAGREEAVFDGERSLGALRTDLTATYGPEFATVLERCSLMVDGVRGASDDVVVTDAATVDVLPPFAGG
jgi:molybdopterin converting factor small subunit